jgi:peptidoglycan/LPS O-acetylase OafA/YrhL
MIKVVCALAIVLGHFSFQEFVDWTALGFDGSAPRFAVPAFFMISGYLTMLSLDRSTDGWAMSAFDRYWKLMFVVLPMLFVVPLINRIGFDLDPAIYLAHEGSGVVHPGGPESIVGFMRTVVISMFYLNEIFLFNVTGIDRMLGGVGAFGNAPFWFLCYLMPYVVLLTTLVKARGPMRAFVCSLLILLAGPPILMLSPLFFSGVVAYLLHRRHRKWVSSAMNRGPTAERDRVEVPAPLWVPAHRGQTST